MKIYVAAPFGMWEGAAAFADGLVAQGHLVTSSWLAFARERNGLREGPDIADAAQLAAAGMCLADVDRADAIIVMVPPKGGTGMWVELGYALALPKLCFFVAIGGATEESARERSIFLQRCEPWRG